MGGEMIQMGKSPPCLYTCKLCKQRFPAGKGKFFKSSVVRGGEDFQCAVCCAWEGEPTAVLGNINTELMPLGYRDTPRRGAYDPP